MRCLSLDFQGAFFNADKAFDTKDARKTCFNHGPRPNIDENKRNRKTTKRGRKDTYFLGAYFIAFAMVNLRHVIQQ
jgi:hypothetical protein